MGTHDESEEQGAMSGETTVLEVRDLTVRYGRKVAVDGVSLGVKAGEVFALLGRNGAGKTSLLRAVLGQMPAAKGEVRLFGADPWSHRASLLERVGVVPETPDAPPEMTPRALSRFCSRLNRRWKESLVSERLEAFEVPLDVRFETLSRGQKAAVMMALALGHEPELLILDDPTLGLDLVARRAVFGEVIHELAERGTTVLVTTHDLAGVEGLVDRVALLRGARLVAAGVLEALKAEHGCSLEELFIRFTTDEGRTS
jgi:ABC-2 type transport system ATP-binding protein